MLARESDSNWDNSDLIASLSEQLFEVSNALLSSIPRSANQVAHWVATHMKNAMLPSSWKIHFLIQLSVLLIRDFEASGVG